MANTLPLVGKIKGYFPKHRICVVKVLLLLVSTVVQGRTTNLNKCKSKVGTCRGLREVNTDSAYTRFIRFFKIKNTDGFCLGIAHVVMGLFLFVGPCYLVIDRTNWKIGLADINVLCLGLLLPNGAFVPVIWETLDKKGNSCTKERTALLKRFRQAWPGCLGRDLVLLADREFVGAAWFTWLKGIGVGFVIRLKWQDYFNEIAAANDLTVNQLGKKLRHEVAEHGFFHAKFALNGRVFYFTALRNTAKRRTCHKPNPGDDFVLLVSTMSDVAKVGAHYRKRWGIEVFFRHVKTNGFNFEDLNLKAHDKVQMMTGVLAIAYAISISEGERLEQLCPTKVKKHGCKEVSLFRKGFDAVQTIIHTMADLIDWVIKNLQNPRKIPEIVQSVQ